MGEDVELGDPFFESLERTGAFPPYVVRMAKLGQQSGTLDQMMESLADYYEKEYYMMKNIRNAITYPVMMVGMLLIVLFVLFTRVMPVLIRYTHSLAYRCLRFPRRPPDLAAF